MKNHLLPDAVHRSIAVFVSVLLLSAPGAAAYYSTGVEIAQGTEANSPEANRAAAQRAYAEAEQLFQQGTAESRRGAIAKYSEALKLWRAVGDRRFEALTLNGIGLTYYTLNDYQKTLEYYNQALEVRRALKDRSGEAVMLSSLGGVYSNLGEKQKALDFYNQALALFRALKNRLLEAFTLNGIGGVYFDLGDRQKALDSYKSALAIQQAEGDASGAGSTLQTIGRLYVSLGETQQALESLNQALALQQAAGSRSDRALTLSTIGTLYTSLGNNKEALNSYNQALAIYKDLGESAGQAVTLQGIAAVYNSSGEPQKAIDTYNQALVLLRASGNRFGEAGSLNNIGIVYDSSGEPQKALEAYNAALALNRALGDKGSLAFTLNNIGGIYNSLGEKQKALDSYNSALALVRAVGEKTGEANALRYIAEVYSSLGDYQSSIESYNQALSLFRATGDKAKVAQTLDNMGGVYRLSGDNQKALESVTAAIELWRAQGNRFQSAATLTTLVRIYEALGDYQQALKSATAVQSLGRELDNRFLEAAGGAFIGRVYRALGENQKALDSLNQVLPLWRGVGSRAGEAAALDNIGKAYDGLGNTKKAIDTYNQALSVKRVLGDRQGEAETLYSIASAYRMGGNLKEARDRIEETIDIVESLRTKVASQELRTSYFASVQKYYQFYIDLLMQLHKQRPTSGYDGKALQVSEQARARSLLEILTEAGADIRQGVNPVLLERERTLLTQINAKAERQQQLAGAKSEAQAAEIKKEIDALLTQYQEVQAQIRATSPRYAALTQPQPIALAEIQQQLLDDNTLLLEYSLGEERSYLWAVTKTGITSYELPKRADIEAAARRFREALTASRMRTNPASVAAAANELSQIILKPVAGQLGKKRLLIVSDGALQYIPFAALSVPGRGAGGDPQPLIVEHEIVNLPSASTLAIVRRDNAGRKPAAKTVAMLADPVFSQDDERVKGSAARTESQQPAASIQAQALSRSVRESGVSLQRLPFTRSEAEQIMALVPENEREQAFDFAATLAKATSPELGKYRIVHFATHGILNSEHPDLSGIVLSLVDEKGKPQNGFLRMLDVWNLKLPVELVVLSACKTGLGQDIKGEGLVGLTRAFMYAGATRVTVSLWGVSDSATAELMTRFYRGMLKEKLKPAAALRAAQVEMLTQTKWKSPYYWAPFVLQGEWN